MVNNYYLSSKAKNHANSHLQELCQMRFLHFAFFLLRVMFVYYFLINFSIELIEICCPSLLNIIVKTYIWDISLNIMLFLSNKM